MLLHWQFPLGPGQGQLSVSVRIIGTTVVSSAVMYAYAHATIYGVNPVSGSNAGGTTLTITGANFGLDFNTVHVVAGACAATNRVLLGSLPCQVVQVRQLEVNPRHGVFNSDFNSAFVLTPPPS